MGWYAAKAYGVTQPLKDVNPDPSAIKTLTVEESVNALLLQVRS